MSFLQFYRIVWARRWIIVAAMLACLIAAALTTQILPVRYEAKSRVLMDVVKPDAITGQVISSGFVKAYTRTQAELIRDYRVTGPVVDALGWTGSPDLLASFNRSGGGGNRDFRRWLAQIIATNTSVAAVQGSNILEITYTSNNPESARTIADAVRAAFVDQSLAFKRSSAAKSADWFDTQVAALRDQLAGAEKRKTEFERANRIVLQDDATDTETARLRAMSGQAPASTMAAQIAAGGMSPAAMQVAQLDSRIAATAQTLGPNHPELIELKRQRALMAIAASQEGGAVRSLAGPSQESQVKAQEAVVIGQREKVEQARRLLTQVTVLRDQFAKTSARAAELRQQAQADDSGLSLLGSAVTPESPVFPNMPLILIGSVAAGLVIGICAALFTELLSRRVRGVEDLAGMGVPVVIVLGGWSTMHRRPTLMQRLRLAGPGSA